MSSRTRGWLSRALVLTSTLSLVGRTPLSGQAPDSLAAVAAPAPVRVLASWTADRREFGVGDVLTVFVDERTLATARADEFASDDRRMSRTASLVPTRRMGATLDGDQSSDQRGASRRDERFVTEISVRVLEAGPNGLLRVEGRKQLKLDDHQQSVVVRGWVRAQDVAGTNIVEAWRVGDLELLYESNGELTKPKQGLLHKLLGILF